jgi:hypothetical protein
MSSPRHHRESCQAFTKSAEEPGCLGQVCSGRGAGIKGMVRYSPGLISLPSARAGQWAWEPRCTRESTTACTTACTRVVYR